MCLFSLSTGKSPELYFPLAKRKNQNIYLHLPNGNSFVMFHPLKEEIIMLPWTLLKKEKHLLRENNLSLTDCLRKHFNRISENYVAQKSLHII